ncbi:MAG: hypothetical protein AAB360_03535 [Patescibacteria group bacterium]
MSCGKRFQSKPRPEKLEQVIFEKYVNKRQTLNDLATEYGRSISWVRSKIDAAKALKKEVDPAGYTFVADATFFERTYGFLIYRIPALKKNVYFVSIMYESISEYQRGRKHVEKLGFKIRAITLDGRPGVRNIFNDIPVQMCHFHQKEIIRRYLTNNPKLSAGIELKAIVDTLTTTDEKTFTTQFEAWCDKWDLFLKERTTDPVTGRWSYTHRRIRSARRSIKTNLPYLFTYLKYPELNIQNTTNSLDGSFSFLKEKTNIHRGFSKKLRDKIIEHILGN